MLAAQTTTVHAHSYTLSSVTVILTLIFIICHLKSTLNHYCVLNLLFKEVAFLLTVIHDCVMSVALGTITRQRFPTWGGSKPTPWRGRKINLWGRKMINRIGKMSKVFWLFCTFCFFMWNSAKIYFVWSIQIINSTTYEMSDKGSQVDSAILSKC